MHRQTLNNARIPLIPKRRTNYGRTTEKNTNQEGTVEAVGRTTLSFTDTRTPVCRHVVQGGRGHARVRRLYQVHVAPHVVGEEPHSLSQSTAGVDPEKFNLRRNSKCVSSTTDLFRPKVGCPVVQSHRSLPRLK